MMKHKLTHTGTVRVAFRPPEVVRLRETKNFWVTSGNVKYRKLYGWRAGSYSDYESKLDLSSIKEVV